MIDRAVAGSHLLTAPGRWVWRSRRDSLVPIALLLLAVALAVTATSSPGVWIADFRFEHNENPGRWFARMGSIWDSSRGFGTFRSELWPAPTGFFGILRVIGLPVATVQRLFHAVLLATVGTGLVALLRQWERRISWMHVVAALYAMFAPFSVAFLLPSGLYIGYAILPWLLLFAVRGIREADPWRWAAATVVLTASVGTVDRAGLGFTAIAVVVLGFYLVLVERTATWGRAWGWSWRTAALGLPALAASLAGLIMTAEVSAQDLRESELAETVNVASSWPESWRGLGYWLLYLRDSSGLGRPATIGYFTSPWVFLATFAAPLVALAAIAFNRRRERVLHAFLLTVGLVLMVGSYPLDDPSPWGRALGWVYETVPVSQVLRNSFKAGSLTTLATAALLGMGVHDTGRWVRRRVQRLSVRRLATPLLGLALLGPLAQPVLAGGLYGESPGYRDLPTYVLDSMDWLDDQPGDSRVWFVPGAFRNGFRWGNVNDDIIDALLARPHVIDVANHNSRPLNADILSALDRSLDSRDYQHGFARQFGERYGIEYLVLRNDINWQVWGQHRPSDYDALRTDPEVELVATFGLPGEFTVDPGDTSLEADRERQLSPVEVYRIATVSSTNSLRVDAPSLLVAGDGDAVPTLARLGLLDSASGIEFTGALSPAALTAALENESSLLITDTNRRVVEYVTQSPQQTHTLAAGQETDREVFELFDAAGAETVAVYGDAVRLRASLQVAIGGDATPWHRPANALDGSSETSWLVGGLTDPVGERFRVELDGPKPVTGVRLTTVPPVVPSGRRIGAATIRLSDGTSVRAEFENGRYEIAFEEKTIDWAELVVSRVDGQGGDPVGISSLELVGLDLVERLQVPDDVFIAAEQNAELDAALARAPVGYAFRRVIGDGLQDQEREVRRRFRSRGSDQLMLNGHVQLGGAISDDLLADLEGRLVSASGSDRYRGLVQFRGNGAVDGDLASAWVADASEPVTLTITGPEQRFDTVLIRARHGSGLVQPSAITIEAGDVTHRELLDPSPCSVAQCALAIRVRLPLAVTTEMVRITVEAASGPSGVERPIRLDEVELGDVPNTGQASGRAEVACRSDLVFVDGRSVDVRLAGDGAGLVNGRRLEIVGCDTVALSAGEHELFSGPGILLDDVTLTPPLFGVAPALSSPGTIDLTQRTPTDWDGSLTSNSDAMFVLGQSWHPDWEARLDGRDLGPPLRIDGMAAWRVPAGSGTLAVSFGLERVYEGTQLVSLLAVAAALAVLVCSPRRGRPAEAVLSTGRPLPLRGVSVGLVAAPALVGYLIGGWLGALLGASFGSALTDDSALRKRLPALLALATLAIAVLLAAAATSFDVSTFGGAFPGESESATQAGRLAGVLLAVSAIVVAWQARATVPARLYEQSGWPLRLRRGGVLPAMLALTGLAVGLLVDPDIGAHTAALARDIALGRGLTSEVGTAPAGPVLAALWPFGARLVVGASTAVVAVGIGLMARRRLPAAVAWLVGAGSAVLLAFSGLDLGPMLAVSAQVAASALLLADVGSGSRLGITLGLGALGHPVALAGLALVPLPASHRARRTLTAAISCALVLAPWLIWRWRVG